MTNGRVDVADSSALIASVSDLPGHEVERLLASASGRPRTQLLLGVELDQDARDRFAAYLARRRSGEPLQYIEGRVPFGPIELTVDARALVPRPETEQLYELVVDAVDPPPRVVVDLCTGSGNLALALKHTWPDAIVWGTDVSPDAVSLVQENSANSGLEVVELQGDLFDPLPGHLRGLVDVVVANPPYLSHVEYHMLPSEVGDYEPAEALIAGSTGNEVLARIAAEAVEWLRPGGLLACEISEFRGDEALRLFAAYDPEIVPDLNGRDRFVFGQAPRTK